MNASPYTVLSNYRCPSCASLLHALEVDRTAHTRARWQSPADYVTCPRCNANLRLRPGGQWRISLLQLVAFVAAAVLGFALVSHIPWLDDPDIPRGGPTLLGFVIVLALFVFPAVALCNRLRSLEVLP